MKSPMPHASVASVVALACLLAPHPAAAQMSPDMGPYFGPIPPVYRYVDPPGPRGYMRAPRHTHRHEQDATKTPPYNGDKRDIPKAPESDNGDRM
jgi:hypothetical protein